jgi:hypothetical protein
MLNGAAWALADLLDGGAVGREEAVEMLARLVERVMARGRTSGRRRKAAASVRPRERNRTSKRGPHD